MASSTMNEDNLEKRLLNVTNTQENIQTLSLWCLHHKAHYAKIIDIWLKVIHKVKPGHRLALMYLANDVIQNSKRKGFLSFGDTWREAIKQAIPLLKDEKTKNQLERILAIWEERSVFDAPFIAELRGVFASSAKSDSASFVAVNPKVLAEFKPQKLVEKIRKFRKTEADLETKHKHFVGLKLDVCSSETLKQLKDKAHGTKFTKEFDDATCKLEELVQLLQRRVRERKALLELLEQSEVFYDTQRKEAKIVANAYKNFGARVKNLQAKLTEHVPTLPSPPPEDAPSPPADSPGGADNNEAVDMEMSDDDSSAPAATANGAAPPPANDRRSGANDDDAASDQSAPSPDGSPVRVGGASPQTPAPIVTAAPPIKNGAAKPLTSAASSLDIRLSNLMHNIPNFASSLFGARAPTADAAAGGGGTPLKDEESAAGSATPLQDETFNQQQQQLAKSGAGVGASALTSLLQDLSAPWSDAYAAKPFAPLQPPPFGNFTPPPRRPSDAGGDGEVKRLSGAAERLYQQKSNIVQLTPSPSASPTSAAKPPTDAPRYSKIETLESCRDESSAWQSASAQQLGEAAYVGQAANAATTSGAAVAAGDMSAWLISPPLQSRGSAAYGRGKVQRGFNRRGIAAAAPSTLQPPPPPPTAIRRDWNHHQAPPPPKRPLLSAQSSWDYYQQQY